MISALDIKRFVLGSAVENVLVATEVLAEGIEGVDHFQAELFSLVFLGDGDLFDVADKTAIVDTIEEKKGVRGQDHWHMLGQKVLGVEVV